MELMIAFLKPTPKLVLLGCGLLDTSYLKSVAVCLSGWEGTGAWWGSEGLVRSGGRGGGWRC